MALNAFLLQFTPLKFSNLNILGFLAVAVSITGGRFILGMSGGGSFKKGEWLK